MKFLVIYDEGKKFFEVTNKNFKYNDNSDQTKTATLNNGNQVQYNVASKIATDWAYYQINIRGSTIKLGKDLSKKLQAGSKGIIMGYPMGQGITRRNNSVTLKPLFSTLGFSQDGLDPNTGMIPITNRGFESGNSGGPVFALDKNNHYLAVGIVSISLGQTSLGALVPVSALK